MRFYLKGYYGYKNLWDEFLLLGLLSWLSWVSAQEGSIEHIVIETKNKERLTARLSENKQYFTVPLEVITAVGPDNIYKKDPTYIKLFGGGEVISDARPFPYNGRNYLMKFADTIFRNRFWILWGVWTERKIGTKWLYTQILWRAERVVVREKSSFDVASKYTKKAQLYHDFCLNLLEQVLPRKAKKPLPTNTSSSKIATSKTTQNILINVNTYIRNSTTKEKIKELTKQFPEATFWFMPAEIWSDDTLFAQIQEIIPTIKLYDRTEYSVEETCKFIQTIDYGLAARLHVLLLLDYFGVPFTALIYQEKIVKMLAEAASQ